MNKYEVQHLTPNAMLIKGTDEFILDKEHGIMTTIEFLHWGLNSFIIREYIEGVLYNECVLSHVIPPIVLQYDSEGNLLDTLELNIHSPDALSKYKKTS